MIYSIFIPNYRHLYLESALRTVVKTRNKKETRANLKLLSHLND